MYVYNIFQVRVCEKEVATYFKNLSLVLLPLFEGKVTNIEAQRAISECKAIQQNKHFRHYVTTCIIPLLEVADQDIPIAALIDQFDKMTVTPQRSAFYHPSDDDDDEELLLDNGPLS